MIDNHTVCISVLFLQMQLAIHIINGDQDLPRVQVIDSNLKTPFARGVWIDLYPML